MKPTMRLIVCGHRVDVSRAQSESRKISFEHILGANKEAGKRALLFATTSDSAIAGLARSPAANVQT